MSEGIQVQTRQLCPNWAKVPPSERNHAGIAKHRAECQLGCGYSGSDQYVYKFIDLNDLRALLAAAPETADPLEDVQPAPVKRGRKPKETPAPLPPAFIDPLEDDLLS